MGRRQQEAKFEVFDSENPQVYILFCKFTWMAINRGRKKFGARMIWERMRWHTMIEAVDQFSDFKLNDHYPPYYARKFMAQHPRWTGFFEVRGDDDEHPQENASRPEDGGDEGA